MRSEASGGCVRRARAGSGVAPPPGGLALVLALVVVIAACESASIERPDTGPPASDVGPGDAGAEDAAARLDGGPTPDAAPDATLDAGPPVPPRAVVPPAGPAAPDAGWLDPSVDPAALTPDVAPALPPVFEGACPAGWRETRTGEDPVVCEPWLTGSLGANCPAGQLHVPGAGGCVALGSACPSGDWPEPLPATGVVYVQAGATAPGDGSLATPYPTLAAGLAAAGAGTTVAMAKGSYRETLEVDGTASDVTVRGACPSATVITSAAPLGLSPVLRVSATGFVLADVSVVGGQHGVQVEVGGAVTLRGVELRSARETGLLVEGAATLDEVRVHDVFTDGLRVAAGAAVTGARLELHDVGSVTMGLGAAVALAGEGTTATLTDVAVHDARYRGVLVSAGSLELRRAVVERAVHSALHATQGGRVTGSDLVLRDSRQLMSESGFGLLVDGGGSVEASRVLVERCYQSGVGSVDGTLTLTDAEIRDTSRPTTPYYTTNLYVGGVSVVTLSRAALQRGADFAVLVQGGLLQAEDVTVSEQAGTAAFNASFGGELRLSRASCGEGVRGWCVVADDIGVATVSDLEVDATAADGDDVAAIAARGAQLTVTRARVVSGSRPALEVSDRVTAEGVLHPGAATVTDVAIRTAGGLGAVRVTQGGALDARALLVGGTTTSAVTLEGADTELTLRDALLATASDAVLRVGAGASLDAERVIVRALRGAPLVAEPGATALVRDAELSTNGASTEGVVRVEAATCTLQRTIVRGPGGNGLRALGPGAVLSLTDVALASTGAGDTGLTIEGGTTATLRRLSVGGGFLIGVHVRGPGSSALGGDLALGGEGVEQGLVATDRGAVDLSGVAIAGITRLGAGAFGAGSRLTLTEASVTGVTGDTRGTAVAAGAFEGASTTLGSFLLSESAECGLEIVGALSSLDAQEGIVEHNRIGACLLAASFDAARVGPRVWYRDNDADLDTSARPVPSSP